MKAMDWNTTQEDISDPWTQIPARSDGHILVGTKWRGRHRDGGREDLLGVEGHKSWVGVDPGKLSAMHLDFSRRGEEVLKRWLPWFCQGTCTASCLS